MVEEAESLIGAGNQLSKRGLSPMQPERAIDALGAVVGGSRVSVGVVDVDWSLFAKSFASMRERPLLLGIGEAEEAMALALKEKQAAFEARSKADAAAAEARKREKAAFEKEAAALRAKMAASSPTS